MRRDGAYGIPCVACGPVEALTGKSLFIIMPYCNMDFMPKKSNLAVRYGLGCLSLAAQFAHPGTNIERNLRQCLPHSISLILVTSQNRNKANQNYWHTKQGCPDIGVYKKQSGNKKQCTFIKLYPAVKITAQR